MASVGDDAARCTAFKMIIMSSWSADVLERAAHVCDTRHIGLLPATIYLEVHIRIVSCLPKV